MLFATKSTSSLCFELIIVADQDKLRKQVKKILNEMVENTLDFVKDSVNAPEDEEPENDCGVRLF